MKSNTKIKFSRSRRLIAFIAAALLCVAAINAWLFGSKPVAFAEENDAYFKTPAQINVAVTKTYDTMTLTFTTVDTEMRDAKAVLNVAGGAEYKTYYATKKEVRNVVDSNMRDSSNVKISKKAYYTVVLDGLEANTHYEYYCAVRDDGGVYRSETHDFYTQRKSDDKTQFEFIYTADPQSCSIDGKAATATTALAKAIAPNAEFMYIGGDLIDGSVSSDYFAEGQYETLFNQAGNQNYNGNFTNRYADYAFVAARGNHDDWEFNGHITLPSTELTPDNEANTNEEVLTYAFSWGLMRLIVINTEYRSAANYAVQKQFIQAEVEAAHAAGQYAALCLHRSLYTGADHIASDDSVTRRKTLAAFLSDINIDMVLQAHDHCLARGQVDGEGNSSSDPQKVDARIWCDGMPENGPLYFVGGCSSSYKTYDAIDFTPTDSDPCALDYAFLDINSSEPAGSDRNPGPCAGVNGQVSFTKVTVDTQFVRFDTYMYGYDSVNDVITYAPYLYDSYTIAKDTAAVMGKYKTISGSVSGDTDTQLLVAKKALPGDTVFVSANPADGRAVGGVTVKSGTTDIETTYNGFGYMFVMPDGNVTVTLTTVKDPALGFENDGTAIANGVKLYAAATSTTEHAFDAASTGWSTEPISGGKLYVKSTFTVGNDVSLDDIAGIAGSHSVNGELIMYVNGTEVYRFNAGKYGTSVIGKPVDLATADGFACVATSRSFKMAGMYNNLPTEYMTEQGQPLFEAGDLAALHRAVKKGENVLTCLVISTDGNDVALTLDAQLLTFGTEAKSAWDNAGKLLDALEAKYTAAMYSADNYASVTAVIDGAKATLGGKSLVSQAAVDALVKNTEAAVVAIPTKADEVAALIYELEYVDKYNADAVAAARKAYDGLDSAMKASVKNYSTLLYAESSWSKLDSGLVIVSSPSKQKYTVGEKVDYSGLKVGVKSNDGTVTEVSLSDCNISTVDGNVVGLHTVTVEYKGMTAQFKVRVGDGSTGLNGGIIALIVVLSVTAAAGGAVACVFVIKKRKKA